MSPSIHELIRLAASGDAEARNSLLATLYPDVERRVHELLSREFRPNNRWILPFFSTSDIVQDVFIGVVQGLGKFAEQTEDELRAWIATQVKNRIIDRLRFHQAKLRDVNRDRTPEDFSTEFQPEHRRTPSMIMSLEERATLFDQALAELRERERDLWRLRFDDELPFAEVAQKLGYASEGSARVAYQTLRAKLMVRMRRLGISTDASQTTDPGDEDDA